ncbi:MAG: hypothetical protein C0501_03140 [Isosphaera sp.]|nr:hypothetical protein [Isosphaera sp.]
MLIVPKDKLKRRTTYREFTAQWLADENGQILERFRKRFEEREAEVAAKMRPGDELWEFEYGDRAFAMTWGLAIVRSGEVVESWIEWKS